MGAAPELLDSIGRSVSYLRVSVTDRCDLRCRYCTPAAGVTRQRREEILRYEEIVRLARLFADLGVRTIRLTGGEPLVRPGLTTLVGMLRRDIPELEDLAMTTNGQRLARFADSLAAAGLDRVNVSLDSLRAERYRSISGGRLEPVLEGLEAAQAAGLEPIKLNVVLIRGFNDDEVVDFVRLTLERPLSVRFIEFMPLGRANGWADERVVSEQELRGRIEQALGPIEPADVKLPSGRGARVERVSGAVGTLGFISPLSSPFCATCNRLRLTADGRLRLCLLSDRAVDLKTPLRQGMGDDELRHLIAEAVRHKPRSHGIGKEQRCHPTTPMCAIGG